MTPQSANVVDLWLVRLDREDLPCESDLSDERDLQRFRQIRVPQRQRRFAFRRRSLRHVLEQYRQDYRLATDDSGKPRIVAERPEASELHFSVSSSNRMCAVAISRADIGLDVEAVPPKLDMAGIVKHFIPEATDTAASVASFRQYLAVMRWCRLEAYIKLCGTTLHRTLFADADRSTALDDSHCHRVAVSGGDHLCVVTQHLPFRMGHVRSLDYSGISHG